MFCGQAPGPRPPTTLSAFLHSTHSCRLQLSPLLHHGAALLPRCVFKAQKEAMSLSLTIYVNCRRGTIFKFFAFTHHLSPALPPHLPPRQSLPSSALILPGETASAFEALNCKIMCPAMAYLTRVARLVCHLCYNWYAKYVGKKEECAINGILKCREGDLFIIIIIYNYTILSFKD